jgi:hypothetical protein
VGFPRASLTIGEDIDSETIHGSGHQAGDLVKDSLLAVIGSEYTVEFEIVCLLRHGSGARLLGAVDTNAVAVRTNHFFEQRESVLLKKIGTLTYEDMNTLRMMFLLKSIDDGEKCKSRDLLGGHDSRLSRIQHFQPDPSPMQACSMHAQLDQLQSICSRVWILRWS